MNKSEADKWAAAISQRISDEWAGSENFPEDATLLRGFLQKKLSEDHDAIRKFIGTGIIERDYFRTL